VCILESFQSNQEFYFWNLLFSLYYSILTPSLCEGVMDLVPLDTREPMEDNSYLSERAIFARDKEIERRIRRPNLKQSLLEKYREALDLIGGVPRLAIMADEDPQRFMDQMIALEKSAQVKKVDHSVRFIRPALPPTPLDGDIQDADFVEVNDQS
jgi:hypothetical protein